MFFYFASGGSLTFISSRFLLFTIFSLHSSQSYGSKFNINCIWIRIQDFGLFWIRSQIHSYVVHFENNMFYKSSRGKTFPLKFFFCLNDGPGINFLLVGSINGEFCLQPYTFCLLLSFFQLCGSKLDPDP